MNRVFRLIALTVVLGASVPLLQGCFTAAAVGVGTGALMLADRRPAENFVTDEAIEIRSTKAINDRFGNRVHINATSYNLKVLLTGEAPDEATKAEVEKTVSGVPNVKGIVNEIRVARPSSFPERSNDTYVTSKVKARFVQANRFPPNYVKVVTEASNVYLLGLVTEKEAEEATRLARTTSGVRKVVRVFEYISDEQARQMEARQAEAK